ncbi:MAG: sirohydrochlorin chelatase [Candidatus Caldatribacteriaceae bacterium]
MKAILLVVHGSRIDNGRKELENIANLLIKSGNYNCYAIAYVQFSFPDIPEAVSHLINLGAKEITALPLFLGNGVHVRIDIPQALRFASKTYPEVKFFLAPPIGYSHELVNILLHRLQEAVPIQDGDG